MSKSTGNYVLPMDLVEGNNTFFEKKFEPNIIRFCFLQAHYRSVLDISNEAMLASEKGYNRLVEAYKLIQSLPVSASSSLAIATWKQSCYDAMNDDFNTPILIAQLFEGVRYINLVNDKKETLSSEDITTLQETLQVFLSDILGINLEGSGNNSNSTKLEGVIEMLIEMRNEARANKNWGLSDEIRDRLAGLGIQLKDGKEGTGFTV